MSLRSPCEIDNRIDMSFCRQLLYSLFILSGLSQNLRAEPSEVDKTTLDTLYRFLIDFKITLHGSDPRGGHSLRAWEHVRPAVYTALASPGFLNHCFFFRI